MSLPSRAQVVEELSSKSDIDLLLKKAKQLESDREAKAGEESEGCEPDDSSVSTDSAVEEDSSPESALAAVQFRLEKMALKHEQQRLRLRKQVADFAMRVVVIQLFIANVLFAGYLFANIRNAAPQVMIAWISATVVEVIGVVFVITRSLFPNGDKKGKESENGL